MLDNEKEYELLSSLNTEMEIIQENIKLNDYGFNNIKKFLSKKLALTTKLTKAQIIDNLIPFWKEYITNNQLESKKYNEIKEYDKYVLFNNTFKKFFIEYNFACYLQNNFDENNFISMYLYNLDCQNDIPDFLEKYKSQF